MSDHDLPPAGGGAPDGSAKEFLSSEYTRICSEIELYIKEAFQCGTYAIIGSAMFWSWVATHPSVSNSLVLRFIPAGFTILCFLKWWALMNTLGMMGGYLKKVEASFRLNGLGWEHHLRPNGGGKSKSFVIGHSHSWGFVILIALNLVLAFVVPHLHLKNREPAMCCTACGTMAENS